MSKKQVWFFGLLKCKKNKSRQRHIQNQKTMFFQAGHDNVFVSPPKLFILATSPNTIEFLRHIRPTYKGSSTDFLDWPFKTKKSRMMRKVYNNDWILWNPGAIILKHDYWLIELQPWSFVNQPVPGLHVQYRLWFERHRHNEKAPRYRTPPCS